MNQGHAAWLERDRAKREAAAKAEAEAAAKVAANKARRAALKAEEKREPWNYWDAETGQRFAWAGDCTVTAAEMAAKEAAEKTATEKTEKDSEKLVSSINDR